MTGIPIALDPPDACQSADCFPGDTGPCRPLGIEVADGRTLASYEHDCGAVWQTLFDAFGWPVERTTARVALAEQDRERKNAA
jgi:hypothetical protein